MFVTTYVLIYSRKGAQNMFQDSEIFEKYYNDYCGQLAKINFGSIEDRLGLTHDDDRILLSFFNRYYAVSGNGIFDASGNRPEYGVCVIIAKYILLCPVPYAPRTVNPKLAGLLSKISC